METGHGWPHDGLTLTQREQVNQILDQKLKVVKDSIADEINLLKQKIQAIELQKRLVEKRERFMMP